MQDMAEIFGTPPPFPTNYNSDNLNEGCCFHPPSGGDEVPLGGGTKDEGDCNWNGVAGKLRVSY